MAVTFPNSPSTNDVYAAENGINYLYDGEKWKTLGSYNADTGSYFLLDGTNTGITSDGSRVILKSSGTDPADHSATQTTTSLLVVGDTAAETNAAQVFVGNTSNGASTDVLGSLKFGAGTSTLYDGAFVRAKANTWTEGASHPTKLEFGITRSSTTAADVSWVLDEADVFYSGVGLAAGTASAAGSDAVALDGATGQIVAGRESGVSLVLNRTVSDGDVADIRKNGTTIGSISVTAASVSYGTGSDYRLKQERTEIPNVLETFKKLQPCQFEFKSVPGKRVNGFYAHELQEVVPEAVTGHKDNVTGAGDPIYQQVDQSKVVPLLTAALQEALSTIEDLTARLEALEANSAPAATSEPSEGHTEEG